VPNSPHGTETRNTSRQLIGASTPPTIRPMNEPLMPAMLLMPRASPRCRGGKASVRIAPELPTRNAPPMPCTIRNTSSHMAPARPVIQSMVSSSEETV
jgi:hypothetical protein